MGVGVWRFLWRDVLLIWSIVGQGPTVLEVCAVGDVWIFFSHLAFLFSFVGGPIESDIVSKKKKLTE